MKKVTPSFGLSHYLILSSKFLPVLKDLCAQGCKRGFHCRFFLALMLSYSLFTLTPMSRLWQGKMANQRMCLRLVGSLFTLLLCPSLSRFSINNLWTWIKWEARWEFVLELQEGCIHQMLFFFFLLFTFMRVI